MLRFLRNFTADTILVLGFVALAIVSIPFVLIEVIYGAGILGWLVWAGLVYLGWRVVHEVRAHGGK